MVFCESGIRIKIGGDNAGDNVYSDGLGKKEIPEGVPQLEIFENHVKRGGPKAHFEMFPDTLIDRRNGPDGSPFSGKLEEEMKKSADNENDGNAEFFPFLYGLIYHKYTQSHYNITVNKGLNIFFPECMLVAGVLR